MSNSLDRFFGGPPARTILWLAFVSIVIGFVLATVGLDPFTLVSRLVHGFDRFVSYFVNFAGDIVSGLGRYLVYGAVIVIPVWLIMRFLALGRGN